MEGIAGGLIIIGACVAFLLAIVGVALVIAIKEKRHAKDR